MSESKVLVGDCFEVLATLPDASIDAVVTDPPYGLSAEPDAAEVLSHWIAGDDYEHRGGGFMGKSWDSFVPGPKVWEECLRVLKPGGHLLAFFGTRTFDLGSMAIRLSGFEIRDCLSWLYGSGFPKSLDVSKAIDKAAGAEREKKWIKASNPKVIGQGHDGLKGGGSPFIEKALRDNGGWHQIDGDEPVTSAAKQWEGWGTGLKPAWEPIVLARKPLEGTVAANVQEHGTGAINVDGCRIDCDDKTRFPAAGYGRKTAAVINEQSSGFRFTQGEDKNPNGRWPANLAFDETAAEMLDEQSGESVSRSAAMPLPKGHSFAGETYGKPKGNGKDTVRGHNDSGGASRFFYVAKASRAERNAGLDNREPIRSDYRPNDDPEKNTIRERLHNSRKKANHHPTVKPVSLMRWLVRMVTPPNGTVLDPFLGSGTTGIAAHLEGFDFVGIEREAEYAEIAEARIAHYKDFDAGVETDVAIKGQEEPAYEGQLSITDEAA